MDTVYNNIDITYGVGEDLSDKRQAAALGSSRRYESPFAMEPWNVAPIDMMTVEEFTAHLVKLYGPEYLEPINYQRLADGRFVPVTEAV